MNQASGIWTAPFACPLCPGRNDPPISYIEKRHQYAACSQRRLKTNLKVHEDKKGLAIRHDHARPRVPKPPVVVDLWGLTKDPIDFFWALTIWQIRLIDLFSSFSTHTIQKNSNPAISFFSSCQSEKCWKFWKLGSQSPRLIIINDKHVFKGTTDTCMQEDLSCLPSIHTTRQQIRWMFPVP